MYCVKYVKSININVAQRDAGNTNKGHESNSAPLPLVATDARSICEMEHSRSLGFGTALKSQVVYSKQPKLGLTQEFVVDCAHALWVVHSIKRLV